ncbi:treslin-like [Saccostrea echinata]|uniref:treslin-like n=1 Tax=Saccostrea echinata TaxID=191078 RepID=UPI002A7F3B74|nr:treslin-like [Saccostrea echinata]
MSESSVKCKILFLVDGNQGGCAQDVKNEAKVLANRVTLSAFRILTALNERVTSKTNLKRGNKTQHLKWSYKIYNSSKYTLKRLVNPFKEFKTRYFEEFENEVERNIETAIQDIQSDIDTVGHIHGKQYPANILNKVLNEIVLDYQWEDPDIFSPVKSRRKSVKNENHSKTENFVFLFANSPKNPVGLRQFSGKVVLDDEIFLDSFMPPDLISTFSHNIRLSMNWIDTDVSFLDVNPVSVQFVESAIHKLYGSLIPVETLVQSNRQCIGNIFSNLKPKPVEGVLHTWKDSSAVMGLVSYTSVIEYHLQHQSKLGAETIDSSTIKCNLTSSDDSLMCQFSISPAQTSTLNASGRSPKRHKRSHAKDKLKAQEKYSVLPLNDNSITLRMYGVLPLRDTEFIKYKYGEDFICCEDDTDMESVCLVPFEDLIRKLIASTQVLILVTKSTPVLFVLRPLTPTSATLSSLCLSESLDVEKKLLCSESSPKKKTKVVKEKPWDQLISRAVQHSSKCASTSTDQKNRQCFDPNVLGRTHLPGCRSGLVSLIEKLNNRISQLEFLNENEVETLKELQQVYRQENKPIRPRETVQPQLQEFEEGTPSQPGSQSTDTLPSRGVLMVNKSRLSSVFKEDNSAVTKTPETVKNTNTDMTSLQTEFESEEELVEYLIKSYNERVVEGCENFYLAAQSLVMVPLHYVKDQNVDNPQEKCIELLERGVVLPIGSLKERHQKEERKSQTQIELQLQTVLRFEILSFLQQGDQSMTEEDNRLNDIVTLLRTLSFHTDPKSLSDFMNNSLVENYIHTLPQTLGNVYDELMQPLPVALEAILSPDNSADQSVFSKSVMEAELDKSIEPSSSQPPSISEVLPKSNDAPVSKTRTRKIMHYPSLSDIGSKRQIFVNTSTSNVKEPSSSRKRRKSKRDLTRQFKSKIKLERRQSVAVMETIKSPKGRKLASSKLKSSKHLLSPPFKSPARKPLVTETPSHKQKNSAMWKRQEAERRRSLSNTAVKVVEESPLKSERPSLLSPSQNKRALHKVRRSFYSASAGPLIRSRSMTQANVELGDRIAGRIQHSSGKLNSILKKPPSQSALFKSPDKNSSFLLSQLMGSPTPQKKTSKTPGKGTPNKVIAESPSMFTRSRSPCISKGFPKALFQESPNCRKSQPKVVRHSPSLEQSEGKEDEKNVKFTNTPRKSPDFLVAESPSNNTRSKTLMTPTRKSVRALLFGKSPEGKPVEDSKNRNTPSKSTPRARRLILSKTPVKGQKSITIDQHTGNTENLTQKKLDEMKHTCTDDSSSSTSINDGKGDAKKSPEKSRTPSPKIQRKIRTPSSLNHWQRRKRGRDESMLSPKQLSRKFGTESTQSSQESKAVEEDNDTIFSSLSQEEKQVNNKKRGLESTEDLSTIFSPSKIKRTLLKNSDQSSFRTSYTLHNKIIEKKSSLLSFASGNSEGFDTTGLTDSQTSSVGLHSNLSRMSQASTSSMEFSNANDEVFLLESQSGEKTDTNITEQNTDADIGCNSPVFGSGNKTRKIHLSGANNGRNSGQKVSPSGRKYSPNVSAKSLMHLMNSPLVTSEKVEKSPNVSRNVAIVRHQRPRSRRSLNLQQ